MAGRVRGPYSKIQKKVRKTTRELDWAWTRRRLRLVAVVVAVASPSWADHPGPRPGLAQATPAKDNQLSFCCCLLFGFSKNKMTAENSG